MEGISLEELKRRAEKRKSEEDAPGTKTKAKSGGAPPIGLAGTFTGPPQKDGSSGTAKPQGKSKDTEEKKPDEKKSGRRRRKGDKTFAKLGQGDQSSRIKNLEDIVLTALRVLCSNAAPSDLQYLTDDNVEQLGRPSFIDLTDV